MKKRVAKTLAEEKVLTKKERVVRSLIFGVGFSGFAVPGIYSLTVGSLNSGTDLLHIVFMYFLCALGIIVFAPLFFIFGYFSKPNNNVSSRRGIPGNPNFPHDRDRGDFFNDSAYSGLRGNKYHH